MGNWAWVHNKKDIVSTKTGDKVQMEPPTACDDVSVYHDGGSYIMRVMTPDRSALPHCPVGIMGDGCELKLHHGRIHSGSIYPLLVSADTQSVNISAMTAKHLRLGHESYIMI